MLRCLRTPLTQSSCSGIEVTTLIPLKSGSPRSFCATVCLASDSFRIADNAGPARFAGLKARPRRRGPAVLHIAHGSFRTSNDFAGHNIRTSQRRYARGKAHSVRDPTPQQPVEYQNEQARFGRSQDNVDSAPYFLLRVLVSSRPLPRAPL